MAILLQKRGISFAFCLFSFYKNHCVNFIGDAAWLVKLSIYKMCRSALSGSQMPIPESSGEGSACLSRKP